MRRLAIFSFAFAAATAAYVWLLSSTIALCLSGALLLTTLLCLFGRSRPCCRVRIAALGLAVGLFWSWGYEQRILMPRRALCGDLVPISATVAESATETDYGCRVMVRLDRGSMMLWLNCAPENIQLGDRLTLTAEVSDATGAGKSDSLYYQAKGISLLGFQRGTMEVERPERLPVSCWPVAATQWFRGQIEKIFPADVSAFAAALLSGDSSGLDYTTTNELSLTGITHIISVSGMHISLLVGIVMLLTGKRRRIAALVSIPVTLFFAAMLGFNPSVTRSVIMNAVVLLAPILRRESDSPTSLGLALLLILGANPWAIANVSLQLSFAAMVGLLWLTPLLTDWAMSLFGKKKLHRLPSPLSGLVRTVVSLLAASLGATALTLPLVACYFGVISLVSPLTNLLTVSLLSFCFSAGVVAVVLSLWLPLGLAAGWLIAWPLRFALWIVHLCAQMPYAAVYTESVFVAAWLIVAYAMLAAFLHQRKTCRPGALVAGLLVTLMGAILFSTYTDSELRVTAYDVGQGQCIVLQSEGITAMVDCGGDAGDANGESVARSLLMQGTSRVDVLVLTHFDTDHVCGLEQLLQRVEVGQIFVPLAEDSASRTRVLALAEAHAIPVMEVTDSVTVEFSAGVLRLLPPEDPTRSNASLAALMTVEDYDVLITGDMDMSGERYLLHTYDLPDLEVLVAGHHGSRYSTAPDFLSATMPDAVIISVGENSYGHPAAEVLGRIAVCGAVIYRTDLDGTVTIMK